MERSILTVSPYSSRHPVTGGTRRIHFLNRGLARAGWDVFQFSLTGMGKGGPYRSRLTQVEHGYNEYRYTNPALTIANRILKELGSPQVAPSLLPSFAFLRLVLRKELIRRPVVMVEHPHAYDYVRNLLRPNQKLVHDSHNIESLLVEDDVTKGGLRGSGARLLMERERQLFLRADLAFVCTEEDRNRVVQRFGADPGRIVVIPNGTNADEARIPNADERKEAKRGLGNLNTPVAIFSGSNWPPNVEAAKEILKVAQATPEIHFLIAGSVGHQLPSEVPVNVTILGFVFDLVPYLHAADFALNPMLSGGGSNVKMFDYLAYGLPVLSTPFGARGIDGDTSNAIFTCEIDDFSRCIRELAGDEHLNERRRAARELALTKYDWHVISQKMSDALDGLLKR